jgi:hypothetical protein
MTVFVLFTLLFECVELFFCVLQGGANALPGVSPSEHSVKVSSI